MDQILLRQCLGLRRGSAVHGKPDHCQMMYYRTSDCLSVYVCMQTSPATAAAIAANDRGAAEVTVHTIECI